MNFTHLNFIERKHLQDTILDWISTLGNISCYFILSSMESDNFLIGSYGKD